MYRALLSLAYILLARAADPEPGETCMKNGAVVCVTGGSGYLGIEVVAQLLAEGYEVKATVRSLTNEGKVAPLRNLDFADERLTILEADLLKPGSFDECVRGASVVFHTASPFKIAGVQDPEAELIRPAVEGTEAVLEAAVAAGVKRVVLTSSIAAIMGRPTDKEGCFNEDDWNLSSTLDGDGLDWYRLSKTKAERRAWEIAENSSLEMATICPSIIIGPPRTSRTDSESLQLMAAVLKGGEPTRGASPMVDVRDCAAAHIAAARIPEAKGHRFLTTTERPVEPTEVIDAAKNGVPELVSPDLGKPSLPEGRRRLFCSKTVGMLGVEFRSAGESLEEMAIKMSSFR